MEDSMEELVREFLAHLTLPDQQSVKPFVLGIIGNLGSGKSTVASKIAAAMPGLLYLQGDSARFVLTNHKMSGGENVAVLLEGVGEKLVADGYSIATDAFTADTKGRQRLTEWAAKLGMPAFFLRVSCDLELCRERLRKKYDDETWMSSFERFRVNTTPKMLANLEERANVHADPANQEVQNLIGEINNNGSDRELDSQILAIVDRIIQQIANRG